MNTERPDRRRRRRGRSAAKADTDGTAEAAPQESGEERPSRHRSPVLVASVAAAVLLVGGGGAYLAASRPAVPAATRTALRPGGDGTPPPLALDGYAEGGTGADGRTTASRPASPTRTA